MRREVTCMLISFLLPSCGIPTDAQSSNSEDPDWRVFRSIAAEDDVFYGTPGYEPTAGKFLFRDLKNESDTSLAGRLLGAVGARLVYIDRRKPRWEYYDGEEDPIHDIALYSQPESWGSAFGVCRSEKYEVSFSDDGEIESVSVTPHYGVEGPIFLKEKDDADSDYFRGSMCEVVPPNHTPSYFPSDGVLDAKDLAILLSKAIHLAGQSEPLPYDLSCETYAGEDCTPGSREFLSKLRLDEIDEVSEINCGYADGPERDCYTVKVGDHRLGPFPKQITVKGSTYMNNWEVFKVSIREGFTIS